MPIRGAKADREWTDPQHTTEMSVLQAVDDINWLVIIAVYVSGKVEETMREHYRCGFRDLL